ncbi:Electron transport complex protein rnfC [Spirochaeta thermophila DSM 6578]|uniref:Ion-translocating oxidoreductase complex subunit C n=1 Tax=Winmispira thermophila (strain ATCC 700085 / DSM 6578 / Z-1203) TaxID=869211 RepID=G0GBS1_WINT7|nr:electron transport complex subunit RsxC [Spirochaeta thermophila]AEJ61149.1 Electron transport complex protein rnfC [Spirochaeta thermophila DSM 6578]
MKYATFPKGGIHPHEHKLTAHLPIEHLPLPEQVVIPLGQHLGAPARALVKRGDQVKVGTRIGEAQGFISAHVHSSVSGKVLKVDEITDLSGYRRPAIFIQVEGDEWEEGIDRSPELVTTCDLSPQEIIERIKEAGIVGMGGAGFPTHVKLSIPPGKEIDTLIINGVECEPYLTADHRLMLEKTDEILVGISLIRKALGGPRVFIGIEANKPDAIKVMRERVKEWEGMEVRPLKVKYPQGAEKQLIKALTGREVPSGKLPLDVGCVVSNVGTAHAVYRAVQKGIPLVERVVTVTGKHLSRPGNFFLRVGTPLEWVFSQLGGLPADTGKVIAGGPMMGKALPNLEVPVTKTTSGILVLPREEVVRRPVEPCIRCAKCVQACPMGLEPYLLERLSARERWEEAEARGVVDCVECGSCAYICPASRPLLDYIRYGKATVMMLRKKRSA